MKFNRFVINFIIGLTLVVVGAALFSWNVVTKFEIDDDAPLFAEEETLVYKFDELDRLVIKGSNLNVYLHEDEKYKDEIVVEIKGVDLDRFVNVEEYSRREELYINQEFVNHFNIYKRLIKDLERSVEEEVIYNYNYLFDYEIHIYVDSEDSIGDLYTYNTYLRRR